MSKLTQDEIEYYAKAIANSGYLADVKSKDQAIAKIIFGQDLGLNVTSSMKLQLWSGNIEMHYSIIAGKIKASQKYDFRVVERSTKRCHIEFLENGEVCGETIWDMERAVRMKLCNREGKQYTRDKVLKDGNYAKQPEVMFFSRCMSEGARAFCSEVFSGMPIYAFGELKESEESDVIESEPSSVTFQKPTEEAKDIPVSKVINGKINEKQKPMTDAGIGMTIHEHTNSKQKSLLVVPGEDAGQFNKTHSGEAVKPNAEAEILLFAKKADITIEAASIILSTQKNDISLFKECKDKISKKLLNKFTSEELEKLANLILNMEANNG